MINKEYWDNFYENDLNDITHETSFATFTVEYLKSQEFLGEIKLIDIACGNGRDTNFFSKNGFCATGIDLSSNVKNKNFIFIKDDIFNHDLTAYNVFYLRFVVHSFNEIELNKLIDKIKKLKHDYLIFIETRSTTNITHDEKKETFFKSSIGNSHYRLLYSFNYLTNKFSPHFHVLYSLEDNNLAIHGEDNPYCIRYVLKNK